MITYDRDPQFSGKGFVHDHDPRVAWRVLGWETEADEDTEWTGIRPRTGYLCCVMVGDDRIHRFTPEDMLELAEDAYCPECGAVGCGWH